MARKKTVGTSNLPLTTEEETIRKGGKGSTSRKNLEAAQARLKNTSIRPPTSEEAVAQGLLEKDYAELTKKQKAEAKSEDLRLTTSNTEKENRAKQDAERIKKLEAESAPAATVANRVGGNAAAIGTLPSDAPGGAGRPWEVDETTANVARQLGNRGFPVAGSNTMAFPDSGQVQASDPETAHDTEINKLMQEIKAENASRVPNKGTIAKKKAELAMYPSIPHKTPSMCPHSGCTNTVPWESWAEVQDSNHPDYDAEFGSVACDSCKAKGLKSGKDLPHLQSLTRRGGNPDQTTFLNFQNY